ncbi:MAG: hypothetical protein GX621_10150 [Pirellulaceae bacterium]|nr:hypothetical protein [Pirellulaceae bacterium]
MEPLSGTKQRWHAPKKYADAEKSGLMVKVDSPENIVMIELTWDGGKPFVEEVDAE